jgi:hypothetical protein
MNKSRHVITQRAMEVRLSKDLVAVKAHARVKEIVPLSRQRAVAIVTATNRTAIATVKTKFKARRISLLTRIVEWQHLEQLRAHRAANRVNFGADSGTETALLIMPNNLNSII